MAMSPAERQAQAKADVERIARAWYATALDIVLGGYNLPWEELPEKPREDTRRCVERLLERDVIRVGERPEVEPPMTGQTTIDDV